MEIILNSNENKINDNCLRYILSNQLDLLIKILV